jgi:hypothetical protein
MVNYRKLNIDRHGPGPAGGARWPEPGSASSLDVSRIRSSEE